MNNDIIKSLKFFSFGAAKEIRALQPKEKHFHFILDQSKPKSQQMVFCTDSKECSCPICNFVREKRNQSFILKFKIFLLDIGQAFKKLFE